VVIPKGRPLEGKPNLTLDEIAEYPIVTYHEGFTGRKSVDDTFAKAGITPDIVMSALDADVIKTYVELGLGIGIIASMAYQSDRDAKLSLLDVGNLFENNTTRIALRKRYFLRGFAYEFIELCSPKLDEARGIAKFNPLFDWSEADIWAYIQHENVPIHPLHLKGYPSIGCEPCTRQVKQGEDIRAGRWWWLQSDSKECGLHVKQ
jgi:hypothetical protein